MALADFIPVRETVEYQGGSFLVRGLSLEDISLLLHSHLVDIDKLVEAFMEQGQAEQEFDVVAVVRHATTLVREAPGLVANIIVLAADEPETVGQARTLSMPTQVRAVEKIVKLTFEDAGGPKKFVESLMNLLTSFRPSR